MLTILDKFSNIRVFVFDADGVLTNGQLLVHTDGTLLRAMNIKDGYALQLAVKKGYHVWVISGAGNTGMQERLHRLGVTEAHFGIGNKTEVLKGLQQQYQISDARSILYMGDDMPDIPPMGLCGIAAAPKDACSDVLQVAHYCSPYAGGQGCVRDVIEKVLKIHQEWE